MCVRDGCGNVKVWHGAEVARSGMATRLLESAMDAEEGSSSGNVVSQVHEDLLITILAKLPPRSLLRSRVVCRAWKDAVSSPGFWHARLELRAGERERILYMVGVKSDDTAASCAYEPASNSWFKLQSKSWRPTLTAVSGDGPDSGLGNITWFGLPIASEAVGLLMCGRSDKEFEEGVMGIPFVGNPLDRSWVSLPSPGGDLRMDDLRGLFVDVRARCFKLVVMRDTRKGAAERDKPVSTFVLDSGLRKWCETSSVLEVPEGVFDRRGTQLGVFLGGLLYCFAGAWADCNLLIYDLEGARWSWMAVARPPRSLRFSFKGPVKVRERVLCMAVGQDLQATSREGMVCVQIWELDLARTTWTVVGAMPAHMVVTFAGSGLMREDLDNFRVMFACDMNVVAGQDELYFFQNHNFKNRPVDAGQEDKMAALDLRQTPAAWRWLPPYPCDQVVKKSCHCVDPWLQFGIWN